MCIRDRYIDIPDVSGKDYADAETTLTDAGFTVKKVEKSNDGTHQAGKVIAVSYTHLDVYKRQVSDRTAFVLTPMSPMKTEYAVISAFLTKLRHLNG